jgi:signal transduction histidine kinase
VISYRVLDEASQVIFDNIPPSIVNAIDLTNIDNFPKKLIGKEQEYRVGSYSNSRGKIIVVSDESKYLNSQKQFKEFLKQNMLFIDAFSKTKIEISEKYNKQTKDLIHNLRTLSAQNIQTVYRLVTEKAIANSISFDHKKRLGEKIKENPLDAASALLKVARNIMSMKVEFSVFDKLMEIKPKLIKEKHEIRRVIIDVLQIFYEVFEENKVQLSLDACEVEVEFDYETIYVCFYYLIENAAKYCKPHSSFKIHLIEGDTIFTVRFVMCSLQIKDEEKIKLCDYNFRGEASIASGISGSGIGMYRAFKTLKLNGAEIVIQNNLSKRQTKHQNAIYEDNIFEIIFPYSKAWLRF